MSPTSRATRTGTGRFAAWWPVLLSLLVVLVPTVCVLWFMSEAVENRRQVVRRLLADADFTIAQERLDSYWQQQAVRLQDSWPEGDPAAKVFQRCVLGHLADSVVLFDRDGRLVYPTAARVPPVPPRPQGAEWANAEEWEHRRGEPGKAAAIYAAIAAAHGDPMQEDRFHADLAARALLAQARCLAKAGVHDAAIQVLTEELQRPSYARSVDAEGRLIVGDAQLRTLQLLSDPTDARFRLVLEQLARRLDDYDEPTLPAPQRRFLMRQAWQLVHDRLDARRAGSARSESNREISTTLRSQLIKAVAFPTLAAEELAAEFCDANPAPSKDAVVRLTQSPELWQLASPDKRLYGLFPTDSLLARSRDAIAARALKSGARVNPVLPGAASESDDSVHSAEAGRYLPGWRLAHEEGGADGSPPVADAQIIAYVWTGLLVIGAMAIFALVIARAVGRQMRLTRLRNDLVATVTHELKTPLASIRLLVDTLLEERQWDEPRARDYLQLVAKENMRLSRLIDNFLAFSRMERNKHAFEFARIDPANVVDAVMEAVPESFHAPGCELRTDVADGLPPIYADGDALVTVVLNLLDNAHKYSGEQKHIVLRAYTDRANVCFEVGDNGIGLSRGAARRVFRRFYQVDRRVSRGTGGVGLGLSIVQFIVRAHGGRVRVRSRPGQGSTFTVEIPAAHGQRHGQPSGT